MRDFSVTSQKIALDMIRSDMLQLFAFGSSDMHIGRNAPYCSPAAFRIDLDATA